MANNTLNTVKNAPGIIAKMMAQTLSDNVYFAKTVAKANADDFKGKNGYSAGDTIYTSVPARFTVGTTSFDLTSGIQSIVEEKRPVTLDVIGSVGIDIDSLEFASTIELSSTYERVIKPAVEAIAQSVETQFLTKAKNSTYNLVGTAGSTVFDTATTLAAKDKLNQFLAPKDKNRHILLQSIAESSAANARKGLFQSSERIMEQYEEGVMAVADGFKWSSNEMLPTHTNGNDVTGVAVEASVLTPATGATQLGVDGLTTTTGTVTKGSVFTIANVFAVHPITKATTTQLQQFVVTADATADGSGNATLSISPTIYSSASGSLQNVSALPADEAPITFIGVASTGYAQNLAYHKNAFQMVSVPLILPQKAEFAAQETVDGLTIAIIRDFDVLKRRMITRVDFLGALSPIRPEWACRLTA